MTRELEALPEGVRAVFLVSRDHSGTKSSEAPRSHGLLEGAGDSRHRTEQLRTKPRYEPRGE